jgi:hypothetical protein
MPALTQQRCFNHSRREAIARCPECAKFFCRECVTEHDDRLICASCLKSLTRPTRPRRSGLIEGMRIGQWVAGVFIAWLFFYSVARMLLVIPASFHEGAIWKSKPAQDK